MVDISSNLSPSGTFGAFQPKAPRKKSALPYLAALAAVLILAAAYYLFAYRGVDFSLATPAFPVASPLTSVEKKVSQLPRFRFDVFDGSLYKSLKIYGALPVVADSLGRSNPFIPY